MIWFGAVSVFSIVACTEHSQGEVSKNIENKVLQKSENVSEKGKNEIFDYSIPLARYVRWSQSLQVIYMYYALSELPVKYEAIADCYSDDYSHADELSKKKILDQIKPRIDGELLKVRGERYFSVVMRADLNEYDLNFGGFPVINQIGSDCVGSFMDWKDLNYKYAFTNGDDYKVLVVSDEALVRKIEDMRRRGADMKIVIYAFADAAETGRYVVDARILHIQLIDENGIQLFLK